MYWVHLNSNAGFPDIPQTTYSETISCNDLLYVITGRAVTLFYNGQHHLKKFAGHRHSPDANRVVVAKAIADLKEKARTTRDQPAQIIQSVKINIPEVVHPSLPSQDALRKLIKRARREELPPQPESLAELEIPEHLKKTLKNEVFLIR